MITKEELDKYKDVERKVWAIADTLEKLMGHYIEISEPDILNDGIVYSIYNVTCRCCANEYSTSLKATLEDLAGENTAQILYDRYIEEKRQKEEDRLAKEKAKRELAERQENKHRRKLYEDLRKEFDGK